MSQFAVVLALVFSLIIALLAVANNQPVAINYLFGTAEISAVIIILGAALLGALVIFILSIIGHIKRSLLIRNQRNELKSLQEKIQNLEKERDNLLAQAGRFAEARTDALRNARQPTEREEIFPKEDEKSAN